jgi:insertion element IS1 protein InsB
MWSFVKNKIHRVWFWFALCKRTKQIVAYHLGSRDSQDCKLFWDKVPKGYKEVQTYSDLHYTYDEVLSSYKHKSKSKKSDLTTKIERFNLTIRNKIGRLVRKSLSYSRCELTHEACIRIFIHDYNKKIAQKFKYEF